MEIVRQDRLTVVVRMEEAGLQVRQAAMKACGKLAKPLQVTVRVQTTGEGCRQRSTRASLKMHGVAVSAMASRSSRFDFKVAVLLRECKLISCKATGCLDAKPDNWTYG